MVVAQATDGNVPETSDMTEEDAVRRTLRFMLSIARERAFPQKM
jgi:hypothetical protein